MTPELPSPAPLAALPVRRREILEILDTSLKLYRRYFWVLIGWSALVSAISLVPLVNYAAFLAWPLLYGSVACCLAAAVRGQSVKFSQCWAFTKPRYGPLLGTLILSYLMLAALMFVLIIAGVLIGVLGSLALANAPQPVQIVGSILGFILAFLAFCILSVGAFGWLTMVPIVVCLEDDKRSTAAMGRAFDLLKGNWRRVLGLSLILGLAVLAVFTIVGMIYAIIGIGSASDLFSGANPSESAILGVFASVAAFLGVFGMIWNPVQTLVIAVLYLDLRVRREALDLEWTAYASAPPPVPTPSDFAPLDSGTGAALRVGSPFGETASTFDSPASFGAGRVELAPTPQIPLPTENINSPIPEAPLSSTFAPVNVVSPTLPLNNPATDKTSLLNIPQEQNIVVTENNFSAPSATSQPTVTSPEFTPNNFAAPAEFPLTNTFELPKDTSAPDEAEAPHQGTGIPTTSDFGQNEARRD